MMLQVRVAQLEAFVLLTRLLWNVINLISSNPSLVIASGLRITYPGTLYYDKLLKHCYIGLDKQNF